MTRSRADAMQCSPAVVLTDTDNTSFFLFCAGDMVVSGEQPMQAGSEKHLALLISGPVRHMQGQLHKGGAARRVGG